jgi:hypothetical protein
MIANEQAIEVFQTQECFLNGASLDAPRLVM